MIKNIRIEYTGLSQIVLNNPQTVDPLNHFTKEMAKINKKKVKTEDDINHRYDLEIAAKLYWKSGKVVIPTTWVTASVCKVSHKLIKVAKSDIRSAFFPVDDWAELKYRGADKVKTTQDIIENHDFRWLFPTKQGQAKIMKAFPMFEEWSFTVDAEFDDSILVKEDLERVVEHAAKYNGFGDFRPTFGRAKAIIT